MGDRLEAGLPLFIKKYLRLMNPTNLRSILLLTFLYLRLPMFSILLFFVIFIILNLNSFHHAHSNKYSAFYDKLLFALLLHKITSPALVNLFHNKP